ncbi:hypothetical protein EJ04DRAFT_443787 [Polyplosphaeria fusca]|uniref:Ecp2 effector protein domain-containing protein n=1 Tax=Polyplosphaeria fusca TaxID=682080 RepID=A0A9P4UWH0_9PLEO|nr:hypothetical protein EJ04DRAFT_443787 [Polyplosphaeria fusca]
MHFSTALIALAFTSFTSSFVIPADKTADGLYMVEIRSDGTEHITKVDEAPVAARDALSSPNPDTFEIVARAPNQIWCGCGFNMNPKNCDDAVSDVRRQLFDVAGPGGVGIIPVGQSFYAIKTNVVAFACNRGGRRYDISPSQFSGILGRITDRCGRYISGAFQLGEEEYELIVGYQRWSQGTDFCRGATTSPANHC